MRFQELVVYASHWGSEPDPALGNGLPSFIGFPPARVVANSNRRAGTA